MVDRLTVAFWYASRFSFFCLHSPLAFLPQREYTHISIARTRVSRREFRPPSVRIFVGNSTLPLQWYVFRLPPSVDMCLLWYPLYRFFVDTSALPSVHVFVEISTFHRYVFPSGLPPCRRCTTCFRPDFHLPWVITIVGTCFFCYFHLTGGITYFGRTVGNFTLPSVHVLVENSAFRRRLCPSVLPPYRRCNTCFIPDVHLPWVIYFRRDFHLPSVHFFVCASVLLSVERMLTVGIFYLAVGTGSPRDFHLLSSRVSVRNFASPSVYCVFFVRTCPFRL